jgi:hypothetical protein
MEGFLQSRAIVAKVAATTDSDPTSNLHYVCSIHSGLPLWPSLNKEQRQQLTRTVYKGARFILQAPATVDGSICCRKAHILPPAERYATLLMRRYYRIRGHDEDQITIPALLRALSHLDPPVKVIHVTQTSRFLEQDQKEEREKLYAEDSGRTTQSSSLNAQDV